MGFFHLLYQVGSCIPGEQFVTAGADDHGEIARLELASVLREGGGLLRAVLVRCMCCTCGSLDGGELVFEC